MQRAEVMVGMTWIFRIRQRISSPLHWKELEDCYFPSCVHVLTETKFKQDEQTMNEKMEQLDRQIKMQALLMQTLLKKSDDGQKKNDDVDNMEQSDLRNNFKRSSTDDVFTDEEPYVSTVQGAITVDDLTTSTDVRDFG